MSERRDRLREQDLGKWIQLLNLLKTFFLIYFSKGRLHRLGLCRITKEKTTGELGMLTVFKHIEIYSKEVVNN